MELRFEVENLEILRSAYYKDFFFEKIKIFAKTMKYEKNELFQSEIHGRFLLNLVEALMELMKSNEAQTFDSIGEHRKYEIYLQSDKLNIEINENQQSLQKYTYPIEDFINALVHEIKNYLQKIKRLNPRIVLEDQYQLLSSCTFYFDKASILDFNSSKF
ncbi:hypothetical protein ACWV26_11140 [Rummeliibacillus sp. JY-2-4R]